MSEDWKEVQTGVLTLDTTDSLGVKLPTIQCLVFPTQWSNMAGDWREGTEWSVDTIHF